MSVVPLGTGKGGWGKTTLATCLAVVAQQTGRHVVILDTDPQATASQWWESRDEKTPALLEVKGEEIARAVAVVQEKGFDVVIIDTPARAEPINAAAAQVADFCLIPCQPVVYLHPADKYPRLTHRPSQGQKGIDERALMASQRPSHPW